MGSMRGSAALRQPTDVDQRATAVDRHDASRSTSVDQSLVTLQQVVKDLGYTLDALQAAMRKDRSYIDKVLKGEKPMPPDFIDALPDDVEAEWHARRAKSFGRVVVAPVQGPEAVAAFVGGLMGMLAPQLPAKLPMLKASLRKDGE